jgi:nitrite reductase/ring-hydroxylating ferredoxin subunit
VSFSFVCRTAEVPRSECREFRVGGRAIVVCEYGGEYYAHSAFCTHQTYSLDYATVRGGRIECPWHRYCYDVVTGKNEFPGDRGLFGDPTLVHPVAPLATFPTERREDGIYVDVSVSIVSS